MRSKHLFVAGALALAAWSGPALSIDPSDVPWDEIDRVLKNPESDAKTQAAPDAKEPSTTTARNDEAAQNTKPNAPPDFVLDDPAPAPSGSPSEPNADPNAVAPDDAEPAGAAGAAQPADDASDPAKAAEQPPVSAPAPVAANGDLLYLPFTQYIETLPPAALADFDEADRAAMVQFYGQRMGAAMWVTKTGFNDDAKKLIEEIGKADDWGLRARDFKVPELASSSGAEFSQETLTDAEARLTLTALTYARQARGGRITDPATQLSSYLDRKPNLIAPAVVLQNLATSTDKAAALRGFNPQHPAFEALRQKLIAQRTKAAEEKFEPIPSGKNITPGKSHAHIALIRKRLKVASPGMKPDGTAADDTYYDQTLASAVVRFKEANEIEPANATITKELRNALNFDGRIGEDVLLANMEQWRWMPDDLGAFHIEVNIPEFMVRVVQDGKVIHEERIITGKREQQTPVFSHRMSTIVFQPRWIVPNSIKVNELLPGLRYGGNPIARQGLVIERNGRRLDPWEIDWYQSDIRNYDIYQPPGPSNVLGVVKFLFPNKHAVYLHDTGSKSLFNERVRMFSHGCMRVRNPVRLAEIVLEHDKGWDSGTVQDVLRDGPEDNDVKLDQPIPVHITYFTAGVGADGEVKLFSDVYGHEKRVKLALQGRWNEIEKNRDHLLPTVPGKAYARARDDDFWYFDGQGRRGYGAPGYWSYNAPPPRPYYKKKYQGGGGFFDQLFGN